MCEHFYTYGKVEKMLKEKLSKVLKNIAEESARTSANEASSWFMYQEEEPEEVRKKFLEELEKETE